MAIEAYRAHLTLTGLTDDPTPGRADDRHRDSCRSPPTCCASPGRAQGGPVERADLALHWPDLAGYSEANADAFKDGSPTAPVVYATIAVRDTPLDATGRLDDVYARFFVDKPIPGPDGLVGRRARQGIRLRGRDRLLRPVGAAPVRGALPRRRRPPTVPATCLRDVNFGLGLSILYRFNRNLLGDWRALDSGIQKLAAGFIVP